MTVRPAGVSAADFSAALQQFSAAIGRQWVFTAPEDLDLYRDAYSAERGEPGERLAAAALAPDTTEQVQAIVRIANRFRIPLYPISTGRNLGYGGSAPVLSGSVVLDLKRMNRIIEVNEKRHYCIVEPGVSFFDLYRHLQARGVRLQASLPAPGWGSPIGNALDHGFGLPARDNFRNHCGLEVVLPNGELMRTGMGALSNPKSWATYHYGYGPFIDGIFSQSNFGVITKMGFNLFREPQAIRRIVISSQKYDDLDAIVDLAEYLEDLGLSPGGVDVLSPVMGARDDDEVRRLIRAEASSQQWERLAQDRGRPVWSAMVAARGLAKVCDAQMEAAADLARSRVPGVTVTAGPAWDGPLDPAKTPEAQRQQFGIPSLAGFAALPAAGWSGHIYFSPIIPQTGDDLRAANRVFQKALDPMGLYWGWQPAFAIYPKNITMLYALPSGGEAAEDKRSREAVYRLVQVSAENGWSEYRTGPAFYDAVMDTFSFNDHALRRFLETLKDAIDPAGIMSAGRYGIWPAHLRKRPG